MAGVLILTDDERLFRLVSLLVSEMGHEVTATAPALLITDKKERSARLSTLPTLKIGDDGLPRPFSHKLFKESVAALLADKVLPLLSPTEERLYRALMEASPAFVSRDALIKAVFDGETDDGRLNLYIHYLRKKIEADGKRRIFASRGKGYSLIC